MSTENQTAPTPKWMFWTGCVLSALPILLFLGTGVMSLMSPAKLKEGMAKYGFPENTAVPIVIAEIACVVIYAYPRTAVLGAILLTGYLGGAVATHVRGQDGLFFVPVIAGVIVWLGLFLRDARVRALVPWRKCEKP